MSKVFSKGRVVLYTADYWDHVCPVVRVIGPFRQIGWDVIPGVEWEMGKPIVFPDRIAEANVVIVQRDFPRFLEAYEQVLAKARSKNLLIVYDLDDLLTEMPEEHPDFERYQQVRLLILRAVMEADVVTCPTMSLGQYLKQFNDKVVVLPNYLDDKLWAPAFGRGQTRQNIGKEQVIVGFMGTHSHIPDLEFISPVLIRLLQRYGDKLRLRFWGCPPPAGLRGWKSVEWIDMGFVNYMEFARYFSEQACDIFIAPLIDSPFNACKSALKFLEYSSLGVPGIYSAVGQYEEIVVHGENGLLADNLKSWQEYLYLLIEDRDLRERIGKQARETVEGDWLLSQHAEEWLDLIENWHFVASEAISERFSGKWTAFIRKVKTWDQENLSGIKRLKIELMEKEQELGRMNQEIERMNQEVERTKQEMTAILNSPGWKLVEVLGKVRNKIAPFGSRRERLLHKILGLLFRAPQEKLLPEVCLSPSNPCPIPSVSIILPKGNSFSSVDPVSLQYWVASQTYPGVEVLIWESDNGIAYPLDAPDNKRSASTLSALLKGLRGRYLCLASPDLLQMPETYLEANLIALESENLIFTINMRGYRSSMLQELHSGKMPGNSSLPLLRQVVRTENVRDGFLVDWSSAVQLKSTVIGKVIVYPTNHGDQHLPFSNTAISYIQICVQGNEISLDTSKLLPGRKASRTLHPVNTVIPVLAVPDNDKPTVLMAMPFLAMGGAERVALDVMHHLQDEVRFVIATTEKHEPSLGTTADAFRQITPYVYTIADWVSPDLRLSFVEYLIQRFHPTTLYIANGSQFIYDVLLQLKARYPGIRIVNQVYDHRVGWINRYGKEIASAIDAHIGCNSKICQAYIRRGASPEKVYLIPHGVDTNFFDPDKYPPERRVSIKRQMGLPDKRKIITFMGRLHPQKRPMDFVEMARRSASNPSLFFLMVGDGPLAGVIDAEVQRIGLENLERRPFSSAPDVLAISDVVVLPSEYEGMPLVVLEAQAMGKPVVVTDVGANREVLQMTQGGVIVSRIGDIKGLIRGVERMLENPPDPIQVRQAIVSAFDVRNVAQKYKQVLIGE